MRDIFANERNIHAWNEPPDAIIHKPSPDLVWPILY
jgi:hypothetical protein